MCFAHFGSFSDLQYFGDPIDLGCISEIHPDYWATSSGGVNRVNTCSTRHTSPWSYSTGQKLMHKYYCIIYVGVFCKIKTKLRLNTFCSEEFIDHILQVTICRSFTPTQVRSSILSQKKRGDVGITQHWDASGATIFAVEMQQLQHMHNYYIYIIVCYITFVIQQAKRMRLILLSSAACLALL